MTYCSVVTVLALVGLTKERFGHYGILKNLSPQITKYNWISILTFSISPRARALRFNVGEGACLIFWGLKF